MLSMFTLACFHTSVKSVVFFPSKLNIFRLSKYVWLTGLYIHKCPHCNTHGWNAVNWQSEWLCCCRDQVAAREPLVKGQPWASAEGESERGVNCGSTARNSWERSDLAEEDRLGDGSLDNATLFMATSVRKRGEREAGERRGACLPTHGVHAPPSRIAEPW